MNQLILVLLTVLVTGTVSTSGIWLGSRLTRGNEDRKWRRDRALETYSDFLQAAEMVRLAAHAAYLGPDCGTPEHAKQHGIVNERLAEMYRAQQRASLVASYAVYVSLATLGFHVVAEIGAKWTMCPKVSGDEINQTLEKYTALQLTFTNVARNDLDIRSPLRKNKMPKTPWWQFCVPVCHKKGFRDFLTAARRPGRNRPKPREVQPTWSRVTRRSGTAQRQRRGADYPLRPDWQTADQLPPRSRNVEPVVCDCARRHHLRADPD
jgi:hypothetical protein